MLDGGLFFCFAFSHSWHTLTYKELKTAVDSLIHSGILVRYLNSRETKGGKMTKSVPKCVILFYLSSYSMLLGLNFKCPI